jgi:hypothetical protein
MFAVRAHRSVAVAAIVVVFACQSAVALAVGNGSMFSLWPSTLLLLVPAVLWLLASNARASLVATGVIAVFVAGANWLGAFGYIIAFWLGLPAAALAAWFAARWNTKPTRAERTQ